MYLIDEPERCEAIWRRTPRGRPIWAPSTPGAAWMRC